MVDGHRQVREAAPGVGRRVVEVDVVRGRPVGEIPADDGDVSAERRGGDLRPRHAATARAAARPRRSSATTSAASAERTAAMPPTTCRRST